MKVSHEEDHITQAVIGGKNTDDFGISDSPEFFHILSSTLYTDQILAVVRETICNAWDAHIASGKTDTAIDITINPQELIIRDYGKGIPKELIKPIYCVYGNSTKKNDSGQTGGFGLGCKSPFAYTDNFTVKDFHDGTMTIYNMSKSSGMVAGKPSMTEIMSIPTTESGIEVTIQLKNHRDYERFKLLVYRIIQNGGILAKVNGEIAPTIDYSVAQKGYVLTSHRLGDTSSKIYVRYGNVVYPIPENDAYKTSYEQVMEWLHYLNQNVDDTYSVIFLAEPDSISVTPSRETLSLQEHTLATIKKHLDAFVKTSINEKRIEQKYLTIAPTLVGTNNEKYLFGNESIHSLFNEGKHYTVVGNPKKMADMILAHRGVKDKKFNKIDFQNRLRVMIKNGLGNKSFLVQLLRYIKRQGISKSRKYYDDTPLTEFYRHEFLRPLWGRMAIAGYKQADLYCYNPKFDKYSYSVSEGSTKLISSSSVQPMENISAVLNMRNKRLVVTRARSTIYNRLLSHPDYLNDAQGFLVYVCPKTKDAGKDAIAFFKKQGFDVLDMTITHSWEPKDVKPKTVTPKKVGYQSIKNAFGINSRIDLELLMSTEDHRNENPEFFVKLRKDWNGRKFEDLSSPLSHQLVSLFGDKGVVCKSSAQEKTMRAKGILSIKEFAIKYINDKLNKGTDLYFAFASTLHKFIDESDDRVKMEFLLRMEIVRNAYNIPQISEDSEAVLMRNVWAHLKDEDTDYNGNFSTPAMADLDAKINQITLDDNIQNLYAKMLLTPAIMFLDLAAIEYALRSPANTNNDIAKEIICGVLEITP